MIRFLALLIMIVSLAACGRHREPTVNCFSFMAVAQTDEDCDFIPLDGFATAEDTGA